jgi:hypothetical protein
MRVSHVHCRVRDLAAAARWFETSYSLGVLQTEPGRAASAKP